MALGFAWNGTALRQSSDALNSASTVRAASALTHDSGSRARGRFIQVPSFGSTAPTRAACAIISAPPLTASPTTGKSARVRGTFASARTTDGQRTALEAALEAALPLEASVAVAVLVLLTRVCGRPRRFARARLMSSKSNLGAQHSF